VHELAGKLLFIVFDLLTAGLLVKIHGHTMAKADVINERAPALVASLWLFNPLVMTISSRGNADVIVCFLFLLVLWAAMARKSPWIIGFLLGIAVHTKLFPVIFVPGLILYVWDQHHAYQPVKAVSALLFGTAASFLLLGAISYILYGWPFVQEAFLYHISRRDHRHNFSPYFYGIYLDMAQEYMNHGGTAVGSLLDLVSFIPQIVLMLGAAFVFARRFLPMYFLVTSYAFVIFNRVCTAQYFVWYLALVPLLVGRLRLPSYSYLTTMVGAWCLSEANWLYWAYQLEFSGEAAHMHVWVAAIIFFVVNVGILRALIKYFAFPAYRRKNE
jgi:GPI mannosyltransferase 1 subunit M